jgi:hypothetical protein
MRSTPMRRLALAALILSAAPRARAADAPALTPTESPGAVEAMAGYSGVYYQIRAVRTFAMPDASAAQKTMDLYVTVELGSPWLKGEEFSPLLSAELPKALRVFGQCGLGFARVHVLYLQFNDAGLAKLSGFASSSPYDPPFEFDLFQDLPAAARPLVALNKQGYAESFNAGAIRNLAPLFGDKIARIDGMSFVPSDTAIGYNARMFAPASYSLFAHEMAHVLGDMVHVQLPEPNIMNAGDGDTPRAAGRMMGTQMTAEQCRAVLSYAPAPAP